MMPHLVVVAAGTGGHVMPGLAVAERLRARGWSVSWLGTRAGMERRIVEPSGIAFDAIDFGNPRKGGAGARALALPRLLRAAWQSGRILARRRPAAVFTTGGWIAVPAGLAAFSRRVPLAMLNADAAPLLSMRMLLRACSIVCCGFEGEAARLAGRRARVTGNPVRAGIAALPPPRQRYAGREGPLRVLVVGGSLGASVLNRVVPQALALLQPPAQVVHQCGVAQLEQARAAYRDAGVDAEVVDFLEDMPARYAWADVVVCRAGAITVAELCAAGVASILVPLVAGTTTHQRSNAEWMERRGAAMHLPQAGLAPESLAAKLREATRERLQAIAQAARALAPADAGGAVSDEIEAIGGRR